MNIQTIFLVCLNLLLLLFLWADGGRRDTDS